jgi:hypothetical protein
MISKSVHDAIPNNPVQQKRWPNLANALKYSLSMLAVMMGMLDGLVY